jgi:hypothetical protein
MQFLIMTNPKGAPLVKGAGGLRKLRFAPLSSSKGKRGALRVCYAYLEMFSVVLLIIAYAKNEKADLSAQHIKSIKQLLIEVNAYLKSTRSRWIN